MDGSGAAPYGPAMMRYEHLWSPLIAVLLVSALCVPAAEAACLSAGEARQAVAAGEALRLGAVARSVGGDILDAQLCERGGQLVYRLSVMVDGGRVTTVLVDARSGQVMN